MEEELKSKIRTKSEAVHGPGDKAQESQVTIEFKITVEKTIEQEFITWLEEKIQEIVEFPGFLKATIFNGKSKNSNQNLLKVEYIFMNEQNLEDFEKFSLKNTVESSKFSGKVFMKTQIFTYHKSFVAKSKIISKKGTVYQNALVIGSNKGIGLEFCRQLHARGTKVYACCRNSSPELENLGVTKIISGIDISDEEKTEKFIHEVKNVKFDLVIQNAGIGATETVNSVTRDSLRKQMEVNAFGPLTMVVALRRNSNLVSGGKIIFITSLAGSLGDNKFGAMYGYRMSKAAVNMAGVSLAIDLKSEGISVGLWNPGFVDTEMAKSIPGEKISTETSVTGMLAGIDELLNLETSGSFWHYTGKSLPW